MTRPRITAEMALQYLGQLHPIDSVMLLGIRGYYKDTMGKPGVNDIGIYDDAICVIWPDGFAAFNANTDPSVHRKGIATLKPGTYPYKKGKHHISSPTGYPALRPATEGEELPVTRDGEGDSFGVAINIHKGGQNTTSSEGCQTIIADEWGQFIDTVYNLMDKYHQTVIQYKLVEA